MSTNVKVDVEKLALNLSRCESEKEIKTILKEAHLWDSKHWRSYGDNENNFSIIGNQQSSPDAALVEKLINSIDAVLMKESMINNIPPTSNQAPQNIYEALKHFFNIREGKISNLDAFSRTKLAHNISFIATGQKSKPNFSIIDQGEGQSPEMLSDTILSLAKSNKMEIPFVQGRFNMGGSGVLQFCGEDNFQLIISKRHPDLVKDFSPSKTQWGVTIVRREAPTKNEKSSVYRYLAPNNKILSFHKDALPVHPTSDSSYGEEIFSGTFIKLFEYKIPGLSTNILFDLYNRLSILMPNAALPIRFYERRNYKGKSLESTLTGLNVRLLDDKRNNIEEGFPLSAKMNIKGQNLPILIYAFKDKQETKYKKSEGIIFTINGQNHGNMPKSFFSRKNVGMGAIADSLLMVVNCSGMNHRLREDLFMNSRDRLRDNDLKKLIEKELENFIKEHPALRELREKRRREKLDGQLENDEPLVNALENVIEQSPALSQMFISGERLPNPFKTQSSGEKKTYDGKEFPTFFTLKQKVKSPFVKEVPKNVKTRLFFITDANNDYFDRDNLPGKETLERDGEEEDNYSLNLYNGVATLNIYLPEHSEIGMEHHYKLTVTDDSRFYPFQEDFTLVVSGPKQKLKGGNGERTGGRKDNDNGNKEGKSFLSLPNIKEVYEKDWEKYGFSENSVLKIDNNGESGYDFFINADNIHLKTEIKSKKAELASSTQKKYIYGMVLIGLSLLNDSYAYEKEIPLEQQAERFAGKVSPILIPMIDSLGSLSDD